MSAESVAVLRFASPGLRRATRIALLAVVPSLIALGLAGHFIDRGTSGADFKGGVIAGSTRIVDGKHPYDTAYLAKIRERSAAGRDAPGIETPGYPPHVLLAFVPLVPLGRELAGLLAMFLAATSIVLALRAIDVRDWRCYGCLALTPVALQGALLANPTMFLILAAALAWRWRDSTLRSALVLGVALSVKPLLLPLTVWLIVTGRIRAAAGALAVAATLLAAGFLATWMSPLDYWRSSSDLLAAQRHTALSLVAVGTRIGLTLPVATVLMLGVAGLAMIAALLRWKRVRRDDQLFAASIVICLLASPLVHMHYLALLFVPLGLLRPRFGVAWLLPFPFWLMVDGGGPSPLPAFLVYAAMLLVAVMPAAGARGVGSDPTHVAAGHG